VDLRLLNGFGFIEFDHPREAEDAVGVCGGGELCSG